MDENSDSLVIEIGARIGDFAKSLADANSTASRAFASIEARGDAAAKKIDTSFTKVGSTPSLTLLSKGLKNAEVNAGKLVSRLQQAKATLDSTKAGTLDKFAAGQSTSALALLQQVQSAGGLKAFAAMSGGALGVGAMAAGMIATQTKALADLQTVATEAGVTAAQLAGLQSIFGKLGFSADDAGKLIKTFSDRLLDAKAHGGALSDALDAAGIAFTDENGALRPTIDVLSDLTRYMRSSTDEAGKLKIAAAAVGDEFGGKFADAVGKGGSALDNLAVATNRVGSAITNDLAAMAQASIASLDSLGDHVNRVYSRMKELAGLQLTARDQANVVQQHLQEAIGARAGLDTASNFRDVSPAEYAAANKRMFDAAAAFDKANPIKTLPGGDPREKAAAKPAPVAAPTPANDDAPEHASRRGGSGRATPDDKAPAVIADLQRQLQLAQAEGTARRDVADQIKIANELKRAGVEADSAEGKMIADLVRATDAATVAAKAHNAVLTARKETVDLIGTSLESSLEGVLLNGAKLSTIFSGLATTLARAALQGALLGQGSLAGFMGGNAATATSAGGLLGSLAHLAGFAEGGQIAGCGTGTSDSIVARLSHGEFIVNAKATKASLPLLTAINEGKMPRFASGGQVGATTAPTISMGGVTSAPSVNFGDIHVNANGGTPAQNRDLAEKIQRQLGEMVDKRIAGNLRQQMRSGNLLAR